MIIELEINGARVIISGENLTVNVSQEEDERPETVIKFGPGSLTLKQWLSAKGITQAEFAEIIGSHQVNVNRVVNGKRRPSLSMIQKIQRATAREVNAQSFLSGMGTTA